jgi:hypothetical protein
MVFANFLKGLRPDCLTKIYHSKRDFRKSALVI